MQYQGISRSFAIKWADLDTNGHLRYSVYVDFAVDTQFRFGEEYGYTPNILMGLGFGPVILRMNSRYTREVTFEETVTDYLLMTGLSPDGARWKTRHDIVKANGKLSATIKLEGVWVDVKTKKAIAPPSELLNVLNLVPKSDNFKQLRSFIRSKKK